MWISVAVSGELDLATVRFFEDSIAPYRGREGLLLFDLGGVTFVDVVGIKPIVQTCAADEARIGVTSESVRRLLRLLDGFHYADPWFAAPTGHKGHDAAGELSVQAAQLGCDAQVVDQHLE